MGLVAVGRGSQPWINCGHRCLHFAMLFGSMYELFQLFPDVMYSIVRGSTSGEDQRCACHTDQDPQLSGSCSVFWCSVLVLIFIYFTFLSFSCYFQGYLLSLHWL